MEPMDELKQFAKDTGQVDLLNSLLEKPKPRKLIEKHTKAEIKHRQRRKKRNKIVKASKRKNR